MEASQNSNSVLEIVDVAYRAVVQLDCVLRDWAAAPSAMLRLQETTTRLHDLLVSVAHAQNHIIDTVARPNQAIASLAHDIAFTRSILSRLEDVLEGAQPVSAKSSRRDKIQQDGLQSRARWVQRSTLAEVQKSLDDCYQRLLVRLMALNV